MNSNSNRKLTLRPLRPGLGRRLPPPLHHRIADPVDAERAAPGAKVHDVVGHPPPDVDRPEVDHAAFAGSGWVEGLGVEGAQDELGPANCVQEKEGGDVSYWLLVVSCVELCWVEGGQRMLG